VACALYRFLVIENSADFSPQALLARAKAWLRDFAVPAIFLVCYLGMKWWMGQHSTIPMAPGLTQSRLSLALVATKGLFSAFLPGLGPNAASWLARGWNGDHYLRVLAAELLALTVSLVLLKPVYRFLLALTTTLVVFSALGLGAIVSRHLYLIVAPSAILWGAFIVYLAARVRSWLEHSALPDAWAARLAFVPAGVLAIAFAVTGFRYAAVQQDAWLAAGSTVHDAVTRVDLYARANPTATTLYVVNLPDSFVTPTGDAVYLFRNVPPYFVQLPYPGRFKQVVAVRTLVGNQGVGVLASEDLIAQWSHQPGTLILWYDDSTRQLRQ
jgi:hypothetical protein